MTQIIDPWYKIDNIDQLDTPVLVVYPQRVEQNIKTLISSIGDVSRLRPHIKTHKSKEVVNLLIDAGISKFKCATIAEAELLGMCGAKDVLLAYQPFGPKLKRLLALIEKYPSSKYSCLVDNLDSAKKMDGCSQESGLTLSLYLDLNVGMDRTGIRPNDDAFELYKAISMLNGLQLVGLHAYDGHIYETNMDKRTAQCNEIYTMVSVLKNKLVQSGFDNIQLVMGGSPSFPIYAKLPDVECSPGTFVFWDKNYADILPEQKFLPAALVVSRIISMPEKDRICLDLGHKAIAAENELSNRVFFLNAPHLKLVGQSEEHLVATPNNTDSYQIGEVLYGIPYHICPTCALYSNATLVKDGQASGHWEISARDRKLTI